MAFIDEMTFQLEAGDGGPGVVRWLHIKGKEWSGPAGGNGGKGGDVYVQGVSDMNILSKYAHETHRFAQNGESGRAKTEYGAGGDDLILKLPVGSVVTNKRTGEIVELLEIGQTVLVLKGGQGGWGNAMFKSSVNRSPEDATGGKKGERDEFHVELQLIAAAGFIGLPSVGKSTLLNIITGAKSKTAAYHFTTLEPYLGPLEEFILADIPGLIGGAAEGKGLGHKFLRHIERTKVLLHCIAVDSDDPMQDYRTIRAELEKYSENLGQKPEVIVLTKTDEIEEEDLEKLVQQMSVLNENVLTITILDDDKIKQFRDKLVVLLRQ